MKITRTLVIVLVVSVPWIVAHAQYEVASSQTEQRVPNTQMANSSSPHDVQTVQTVGQQLAQNSKLAATLQTLLPAGMDVKLAAHNFDDLNLFATALHVSNNLKIPFEQLSAKLTGMHAVDLKKAIHELKPEVDNKAEVKKANDQAKQDIKDSKRNS